MIKVFISRKLDVRSPFFRYVDLNKIRVIDEYLIHFDALPFHSPNTTWLFFYSKTGVRYFLSQNDDHLYYKVATFGQRTAAFLEDITGRIPDFIGSGNKESVANDFALQQNYGSCTFIVGENSLRSIQKIIPHPSFEERIVYRNYSRDDLEIENVDIGIFTSPLSVKTYFSIYPGRVHPNIAIGNTTAAELKRQGKSIEHIASQPSEEGLANALNSFIDNNIDRLL